MRDQPAQIADRPKLPLTLLLGFLASTLMLLYGARLALFVAPAEATMGNVQRIFYWHVPVDFGALIFPYVNLAGSIWLLAIRKKNQAQALVADALAVAGAELALLYTSLGLMTGVLWARPVWGIWWTWDARLTTFLLLWVLYAAYLLLRRFSGAGQATSQTAVLSAVLGIFAAVDVPITYMSIRWWRTQHPAPVLTGEGHLDSSMVPAFLWNLAGWLCWGVCVLCLRFLLERRRQGAAEAEALRSIDLPLEATL